MDLPHYSDGAGKKVEMTVVGSLERANLKKKMA